MKVLQLINASEGESPRIEALPNPDGKDLDTFLHEGIPAIDVGSDLLIKFVYFLAHADFRVLEISLVDRYFAEAPKQISEEFAGVLADLAVSDYSAAQKFRNEFLPDYFVSDVRALNKRTNSVVRLGQEGVVHANDEDIAYLSEPLTKASN